MGLLSPRRKPGLYTDEAENASRLWIPRRRNYQDVPSAVNQSSVVTKDGKRCWSASGKAPAAGIEIVNASRRRSRRSHESRDARHFMTPDGKYAVVGSPTGKFSAS